MLRFNHAMFAALMIASGFSTAGDFSYDYVEGAFGELDSNADVLYLGGAKSLDGQFGLIGSLGLVDFKGGDGTVVRAGGLFHTQLQPGLDLVGTLELAWSDFEITVPAIPPLFPGGKVSDDDLGFIASGGVRYALTGELALEGKVTVTEVDPFDDGLGFMGGARYHMSKELSAAAGLASDADFDGIWVSLRYDL